MKVLAATLILAASTAAAPQISDPTQLSSWANGFTNSLVPSQIQSGFGSPNEYAGSNANYEAAGFQGLDALFPDSAGAGGTLTPPSDTQFTSFPSSLPQGSGLSPPPPPPSSYNSPYGGGYGSPYGGGYGSPYGGGYSAPYGGGYSAPYGGGYSAPYGGGYSAPYGGGYSAPYGGGYSAPYGGGYSAPYGGGYSAPYGGGYSAPYGGGYSAPYGGGYGSPYGGGYGSPYGGGYSAAPTYNNYLPTTPPANNTVD